MSDHPAPPVAPTPLLLSRRKALAMLSSSFVLAACGGGGGKSHGTPIPPGPPTPPPPPPTVTGPAWFGYGRDAQHTAASAIATLDLGRVAWTTPMDLAPQYTTSGALLTHYGSPVVTTHNTVVIPVKTTASGGYRLEGRNGANGTLVYDADAPEKSSVEVVLPMSGLDAFVPKLTEHLLSPDFFDAENHPTMRFVSTKIDGDVTGDFTITGNLTVRGTTRPITLEATAEGRGRDPWGNERMGFGAKGKFLRSDFGLTWNQVLEAGGVTVGDEVKISIDVELIRQAAKAGEAAA